MDPDMVRQQEEAEREALAFLRAKPVKAVPVNPEALPKAAGAAAQQAPAAAVLRQPAATFETIGSPSAPPFERSPAAVLIEESGPELEAQPAPAPAPEAQPRPERKGTFAGHFGRFISFGLAGAMLGGSLGIAAANYLQLPADLAELVIFGPAGFFATVCAFASFFAKTPKAYY